MIRLRDKFDKLDEWLSAFEMPSNHDCAVFYAFAEPLLFGLADSIITILQSFFKHKHIFFCEFVIHTLRPPAHDSLARYPYAAEFLEKGIDVGACEVVAVAVDSTAADKYLLAVGEMPANPDGALMPNIASAA